MIYFVSLLISIIAAIIFYYLEPYLPHIKLRKAKVYLRFFRMVQAPLFIEWLFKKRFSFGDIRYSIATILNVFGALYSTTAFATFTYGGLLTAFLTFLKTGSLFQAFGIMSFFLGYAIGIPYLWKKAFILKQ